MSICCGLCGMVFVVCDMSVYDVFVYEQVLYMCACVYVGHMWCVFVYREYVCVWGLCV